MNYHRLKHSVRRQITKYYKFMTAKWCFLRKRMNWSLPNFTLKTLFFYSYRWLLTRTLYIYQPHKWQEMAFCCKTSWDSFNIWTDSFNVWTDSFHIFQTVGGWVRQRCRVSCVTAASIWYWLIVGQGLLSLQQVRRNFFFFCFFTFIHFPFLPFPLSSSLLCFFYLSSPFLRETTQNDPQGLTC